MAISKSTPYVRYKENFTSNLHLGTIHVESEYLDRTQKTTIESIHGMTWHNKVVNENKELDLLSNLGFELTESKKEYFNVGEQRVSVDEIHGMQDIEPNEDGTYTYSVTSMEGEYAEIYDGLNHITSTSDGLDGNFEIIYDTDEEDITGSVVLDATMSNYTIEDSNIGELNDVVFKGETLVNILPQPSLRNKMENVSIQRLNEGHDEVVVADGEYKSAILKGQTLVNIIPEVVTPIISASDNSWYQLTESSPNNIVLTVVGEYPTSWKYIRFECFSDVSTLDRIKPNTKYLIKFDELQNIESVSIRTGAGTNMVAPAAKVIGNYAIVTTKNTWEVIKGILLFLTPSDGLQLNDRIICKNPIMVEYQEGMENWDIPYFEGMQSVETPVLTTTGKNLFDGNELIVDRRISTSNGYSYASEGYSVSSYVPVRPNNQYTLTTTERAYVAEYDKNKTFVRGYALGNGGGATTLSNVFYIRFDFPSDDLDKVQFEEGSTATPYEPYKSNNISVVSSTVKELDQSQFEQGTLAESSAFGLVYDSTKSDIGYTDIRIRSKIAINTAQVNEIQGSIQGDYQVFLLYYENNKYMKQYSGWLFPYQGKFSNTLPKGCTEIGIVIRKSDNSSISVAEVDSMNLTLTMLTDTTLRGIGDVKDELNLITGELTQRIGEVVLDGSEDWVVSGHSNWTNCYTRKYTLPHLINKGTSLVSDKMISYIHYEYLGNNDVIGISITNAGYISLKYLPNGSKLQPSEVSDYLKSNPITIQYPLETESVKTVDLTITDQDNVVLETGKPRSYKDGHIQVQSNGILPSSISYEVPSQNHIHVDMLKPSNTYTLKRNGENFEGSFLIDGTEYNTNVFMTSHQLPNKSLIINDMGENDKVAMFEGNYGTSTIPYFEGMASVEMPVLMTTGKNLIDVNHTLSLTREQNPTVNSQDASRTEFTDVTLNSFTSITASSGYWQYACYRISNAKPNTTYTLSYLKNIINPPEEGSSRNHRLMMFTPEKGSTSSSSSNGRSVYTITTENDGVLFLCLADESKNGGGVGVKTQFSDIQLEEGSVATTYESYKSNILTCNEEVTLRAIGDVKDEYNVETGELTQRIGEVVFDGSEDWQILANYTNEYHTDFVLNRGEIPSNCKLICNQYVTTTFKQEDTLTNYMYVGNSSINVFTKPNITLDEFKLQLQSNPLILQYPLATPIVKKVISTILDQDGRQIHSMHTYTGLTNLSTSSDTLIPNVSLDYEISSSTGTVTGTSATIENGENGSPISAIVYGESLVNSIQEPSDVECVVLGEHIGNNITIENSVEGNIKNAVIKGNTLVNLVKESSEIKIVGISNSTLAKYQVNHIDTTKDYTILFEINDFNGNGNITFSLGTHLEGISLEEVNHNGKFNILIPSSKIGSETNEIWFYWTIGDWVDGNSATVKNIVLIEGDYTNIDIPYFEGIGSVNLSSHTLTNLFKEVERTEVEAEYLFFKVVGSQFKPLKPYTKYTLIWDKYVEGISVTVHRTHTEGMTNDGWITGQKALFTTNDYVGTEIHLFVKGTTVEIAQQMLELQPKAVILEGDYTGVNVPYFEGTDNVYLGDNIPTLTTTNRINVFIENKEFSRSFYNGGTAVKASHDYLDGYICDVEPNTTYSLYFKDGEPNTNKIQHVSFWNEKTYISGWSTNPITFTTPTNCNKLRFAYDRRATNINPLFIPSNIVLSIGTGVVYDESFKSNTLTINEPIELRAIGDMKDELDLVTGKLTQCIGEVVLDGSEDWWESGNTTETMLSVGVDMSLFSPNFSPNSPIICNNMPNMTDMTSSDYGIIYDSEKSLRVNVPKTIAQDLIEFKQWLNSKNLIIYGKLEQPTIKTIDLQVVDQDDNPTSLHSYNDTTHITTNSQGLVANIEISNPSYDVVLKADTEYTLKLNRTNTPTDTPLEINLGGTEATMDSTVNSIAITTPSTLANNKLTMSGLGNKFKEAMAIEGDYVDRDLDYFEGIVGVENPILATTGKNLFDINKFVKSCGGMANGSEYDSTGAIDGTIYKIKIPSGYFISYEVTQLATSGITSSSAIGFVRENGTIEHKAFSYLMKHSFKTTENYIGIKMTNFCKGWKFKDFQIEEGSTATSYEPYQGNILTTYPQVTLHSIGDIKDELDLVNGTITRRIGEVVLNGSEDWRVESGGGSTHTRFSMRRGNNIAPISNITFEQYKCNKFRAVTAISGTVSEEVMLMENYDNYFISLVVKNTRLSTPDAEGLKTWLSQNPTTVIYLITPTTESVRITPPNPQTSTASITLPTQLGESDYVTWNPYKEHYVHYNYEQDGSYTWDNLADLNERQFIELYDRRTYVEQEYKNTFLSHDSKGTSKYVLIEPNQDYTVTVRFSELPQCETVKVNLGGSEVEMNVSDPHVHVTTPNTLSNYLCSISGEGLSGKITDILVIHCLEHEGFADIDYFEGIDSIGEVVDVDGVSKASIIVEQTNGNLIDKDFEVYQNGNGIRLVEHVDVRPNKKYIFKTIKSMSIEQVDESLNKTFASVYSNGSELHTDINTAKVMISASNTYSNGNGSTHKYHPIELCLKGMEKDYIRPRYNSSQEIILPMQLCRINTVYDNFYYDVIRGHYRIQQSIGHKYFTGADNENWTMIGKEERILRFRYNNADIQIKSLGEYMTNRFTNGTATSPYESCAFGGSAFIISIDKERLSNATLTAFKEWLSSHNVHLYYQLATPMMIDLPQYSSKLELNTYKGEIYTFLKNCKPTVFTLDVPLDQTYRFYELQESQGYTNRIELTDERMTEEDALYINTIYGSGISNLIEEPNNVNTLLKPNYEGRAISHTLTNGKVSTIGVHGFEPNSARVGTYNTVTKQYELTVKATSGENNNSVVFPIPYALEQYEDGTHDIVYYNSEYKQWMFEGGQTLTVAYNNSTGVFTNAIEIFRGMMPRSGMLGEFKVKFASGTTSARLYYSLDGSTYTYTTLRSMTDGVDYYIAFFNTGGTKIDMGTKIGADSEYVTLVPLSGTVSEALMINQIQSITECTYYLDKTYYYTEPTRPIELTVYEGTNTITEDNGAIITIENNAHNKDALIYANTPYTVYWTYVGGEGNVKVTLGGVTQEVVATQGYVTITTSDADLERGLLIGGFDVTIKDLMLVKGERIADLSYFEGSRAVGTAFIDEDGNTMYRITLVTGSELIQDKFEDVITFEDNKKHNVLVTKLLGTKPDKN